MEPVNPYSAPSELERAAGDDADSGTWLRDGMLVVPKGGTLPERCVCCGGTEELVEHTGTFRAPNTATVIALGPILGMLLAKRAKLTYFVCHNDLQKQQQSKMIGGAMLLSGVFLALFAPIAVIVLLSNRPYFEVAVLGPMLLGIVLIPLGLVRISRMGHGLSASKIDQTHVHLEGIHAGLLEQARQAD